MEFPKDQIQFGRSWSAEGGRCAALATAFNIAERRSGEAFVRGQDTIAHALRDCAHEIKELHKKAAEVVDAYIKESQKREYQIRKGIG